MKMNKKGFTLIEMLVVIAIIAILVAIIIPVVSDATTKATEAKEVANIRSEIAEYMIASIDDDTATFTAPTCTSGKVEVNAATNTVTYTATKLQNDDGTKVWTWTLGSLKAAATPTPPAG